MTESSLPDGFTVRLSRHTRVLEGGRVLVGGAPTRVVRLRSSTLAPTGELVVCDAATRALAEHLLSSDLADPVVDRLPASSLAELTIVVPVRDRAEPLRRLLASIPPHVAEVIVVDDASEQPDLIARAAADAGARLIALPQNVGTSGARNAGLARVGTPFVAFVDSDVVLGAGCLETLLRHFADPALAVAAPRVLGLHSARANWIIRYENARSSLDLGQEGARVHPRGRVTWVSGTCLVARRTSVEDGFDVAMRAGEDVDLVWRLADRGLRVRYEPAAAVGHEHRRRLRAWLGRKFFYGTGAHPLARRHPRAIAPAVLAPWGAVALLALLAQRAWSLPVVLLTGAVTAGRISSRLPHVARPRVLAAHLTAQGLLAAAMQGVALLLRHWWPAVAVGCLFSRRLRRAVLVAALADTAVEYLRVRPRLDPLRFGVARRLDDVAYGAGVWWSALRARSAAALRPAITTSRRERR